MAARSRFRKTVFDNGLTLLSERHSEFRSLSVGAWVNVGTRHEKPAEVGVSHFLEHMLFKGTKRRSALEIAREIDRVGGDFNAFTAREQTCFHVLLLDRDVGLGLEILADVILNSTFEADELERERKVILQEIAMIEENPEELAHDLFFERLYPRHGLGRPILGTGKSIRSMTRGEVVRYFRRHYRPEQTVISVAGNVSHELLVRKLGPLVRSRWPGRAPSGASGGGGFPPAPSPRTGGWWSARETEQVHLLWGVRGPTYTSRDRFAAFLLNVYLGGGMSSTLFQEIRERNGLAYTVYSSLTPFTDTGIFSIYAATSLARVPVCLKLVEECVEAVRSKPLSRSELATIQDNLKGTILLSADSAESRMSSIAKNDMVFGRNITPEEVCERIDAVTSDDVRALANRLFRDDRRSVLALGPQPGAAVLRKMGLEVI